MAFAEKAVHPLYPPPAGDIERFALLGWDVAICISTGGGFGYRFSPMAWSIAVSPAGGGLRGWSQLFLVFLLTFPADPNYLSLCLNYVNLRILSSYLQQYYLSQSKFFLLDKLSSSKVSQQTLQYLYPLECSLDHLLS